MYTCVYIHIHTYIDLYIHIYIYIYIYICTLYIYMKNSLNSLWALWSPEVIAVEDAATPPGKHLIFAPCDRRARAV